MRYASKVLSATVMLVALPSDRTNISRIVRYQIEVPRIRKSCEATLGQTAHICIAYTIGFWIQIRFERMGFINDGHGTP